MVVFEPQLVAGTLQGHPGGLSPVPFQTGRPMQGPTQPSPPVARPPRVNAERGARGESGAAAWQGLA